MKYMLLIYGNQETWDLLEERGYGDLMKRHVALGEELAATGEFVGSSGLTTAESRTVRVRNGAPEITDGPYAEAKEVLAGYYLVDVTSLDRAIEIAARIPEAELDLVEIRPLIDPRTQHPRRRRLDVSCPASGWEFPPLPTGREAVWFPPEPCDRVITSRTRADTGGKHTKTVRGPLTLVGPAP